MSNESETKLQFDEWVLPRSHLRAIAVRSTTNSQKWRKFSENLRSPSMQKLFGKGKGTFLESKIQKGQYCKFNIRLYETMKQAINHFESDSEYFEEIKNSDNKDFICHFNFCTLDIEEETIIRILKEFITIGYENNTTYNDIFIFSLGCDVFALSYLDDKMYAVTKDTLMEVPYFDPCQINIGNETSVSESQNDIRNENIAPIPFQIVRKETTKKYSVTIFDKEDNVIDAFCCDNSLDIALSKCSSYGNGTLTFTNNSKIVKYTLI